MGYGSLFTCIRSLCRPTGVRDIRIATRRFGLVSRVLVSIAMIRLVRKSSFWLRRANASA